MVSLLVVDPLDLTLAGPRRSVSWSSRACFERALKPCSGLRFEVVAAADPDLCRKAMSADGVILGGSYASAWEDCSFNDHLLDLIAVCRNGQVPFLGICYGAQLLGRALGGEVARHPDGIELGAPAIRISAKGKEHYLFCGIETGCIWSVETHRDAVLTLPPHCELLASTAHSPVQAFSYRGLLNGVQFHPEMGADDLRALWKTFEREGLVEDVPDEWRETLAACECPPSYALLRNFVARLKSLARATSERELG